MTLIEVIVAIAILTGATLGFAAFATRFMHSTTESQVRTTAVQLAADRLEQVKGAPSYKDLEADYKGLETDPEGYTGYTRETLIEHVGGDPTDPTIKDDYKIVTVIVTARGLPTPVRETTVISNY